MFSVFLVQSVYPLCSEFETGGGKEESEGILEVGRGWGTICTQNAGIASIGLPPPTPILALWRILPTKAINNDNNDTGVGSMTSTQPTTPSTTPAYPPNIGLPLAGGPNLGVIPEHLAEGMNNIFRGAGGSPSRGGADSGGINLSCVKQKNPDRLFQEQTVEAHLVRQHQLHSPHLQLR